MHLVTGSKKKLDINIFITHVPINSGIINFKKILLTLKIHGTKLWNKILTSTRQVPTIVGYTTYTEQNNHCENAKGLNPGVIS